MERSWIFRTWSWIFRTSFLLIFYWNLSTGELGTLTAFQENTRSVSPGIEQPGGTSLSHGGKLTLNLGQTFKGINVTLPYEWDNHFVIFQAHTHGLKVIVSSLPRSILTSVTGSNIGSLNFINGLRERAVFYAKALNRSTETQFMATVYKKYDPIPGGCCITCPQEADPTLDISYDAVRTYVKLKRANIYNRKEPCDGKPYATLRLEYHLYLYFLDEGDFGVKNLFDGLWKMSSPVNMKRYGKMVGKLKSLTFETMTLDRQGVVYNVIVQDPVKGTSSAYTPIVTYGCDFDPVKSKCTNSKSLLMLLYSVIGGLLGLIMCFAGLKLFKAQLFLSGMTTIWLVVFICLSRLTELKLLSRMLISTSTGVVGGILLLALWLKTELVHLCLCNNGILLGVLVAATFYYSPLGDNVMFQHELVFFLTFLCITFVVPILFIFFPKVLSIVSSSVIGAYAVMVAVNYFIHGTLVYIVKCFILRMSVKDYADVFLRKPFQRNDIILCCFWALLAVVGMIVQYFTTRTDDILKQNNLRFNFRIRPRRLLPRQRWRRTPERAPLLGDNASHGGYAAISTTPEDHFTQGSIQSVPSETEGNGRVMPGRPYVL